LAGDCPFAAAVSRLAALRELVARAYAEMTEKYG